MGRPSLEYISTDIYPIIGGYAHQVINGDIKDNELPRGYTIIYHVEYMHNIFKGYYQFSEYFDRFDQNERECLEEFYIALGFDKLEKSKLELNEWLSQGKTKEEFENDFEFSSELENFFEEEVEDLIEKFYLENIHLFHPV